MKIILVILFSSFLSLNACADWVNSSGEYNFGPDLTEELACQRAERRAKDNALRKVQGERFISDDMLVCKEQGGNANCDLNRFTWSTINGMITGVRNYKRQTSVIAGNIRTCLISMEVNVQTAQGNYDPSFDLSVHMNEKTFKDGDALLLSLEPSKAMYVNVFQWLPYEKSEKQVSKIFPNQMDRDNQFNSAGTIPTLKGRENYDMTVGFPVGLKTDEKLIDEYLLIVGTVNDINFNEAYSLEDFNQRLLEIPRSKSRLIKRAYMVIKPNPNSY